MRIWFLLDRYLPIVGGSERQAQRLAQQFTLQGDKITVVTRRILPDFLPQETLDGIEVRRLSPIGLSKLANVLILLRFFFYLLVHRHEYDVVQVYAIGPLGVAAALARRLSGKPTFLRVATTGDVVRQEVGFTPSIYSRIIRRYILPSRLWQRILAQADGIVVLSDEIVKECQSSELGHLTHKIPNGVDVTFFRPPQTIVEKQTLRARLQLPPNTPIIVYAGRLVQRKRIDVLLKALPAVLVKHPQTQVWLLGSSAMQVDGVETELQALTQKLGLIQQIHFAGEVSNVREYLQAADVFAFPSENEGMPNVVVEAAAVGLPIVACTIGGVVDILDDSLAWLVPSGNVVAFSTALLEILDNPDIAAQKGKAARQRMEAHFSLVATTAQYRALYQQKLTLS